MAPASQSELILHRRLLERDVTAPAELAEWALRPLIVSLRARFPRLSDDVLIREAAADAIISYVRTPAAYDPNKRGLLGYLRMSAAGDLLNELRRQKRIKSFEIPLEDVEEEIGA